jgi:hypothetical protein
MSNKNTAGMSDDERTAEALAKLNSRIFNGTDWCPWPAQEDYIQARWLDFLAKARELLCGSLAVVAELDCLRAALALAEQEKQALRAEVAAWKDTAIKAGGALVERINENEAAPELSKPEVPERRTIYMPTEQEIRDEVSRHPRKTDFTTATREPDAEGMAGK